MYARILSRIYVKKCAKVFQKKKKNQGFSLILKKKSSRIPQKPHSEMHAMVASEISPMISSRKRQRFLQAFEELLWELFS